MDDQLDLIGHLDHEPTDNGLDRDGFRAGIDEVGRGCLAGPVVAGIAVFPLGYPETNDLTDSKGLSARRRREVLHDVIQPNARYALGAVSSREIDRCGIRDATFRAMARARFRLKAPVREILVDGREQPPHMSAHPVVKGDTRVAEIMAAAIVAKIVRDHAMEKLSLRYSVYGWNRNVGYGTRQHRDALDRFGASPHHRRSFRL